MGQVLHVDFKSKKRNADAQTPAMFASGLDTPVEDLAWFYESSLGYCIPYVAPEIDGA